jgi:hypothetical protein
MGKSLLVTRIREKMPHLRVHLGAMLPRPLGEGFGCFAERLEMPGGVAIPPSVIRDDLQASFKQEPQFVFHGFKVEETGR